uniref:VWFA domain-containing protein n=1 Tax=Oryzias sinensis TaxID=183150 RepID=A0A8C8DH94_9TELE
MERRFQPQGSWPSRGTDRFFLVVSGSDTYLFFSAECAVATVADIVFLVDGSSSIGIDSFEEVRLFLREVVSGLDIGPDKVRVGLAQYSDEPYQEFLLKDHFDASSLLAAIERLPYRTGQTETGKAISFLLSQYFTEEGGSRARQRVPQIAVVITDGDSSDDVEEPAQQLREQGVIVFGIGVGQANLGELQLIANRPAQRFLFTIDNYQALQMLTSNIVFIIDQSGSIGTANFQLVRMFVHSIVSGLDVGQNRVRVGVVLYNDKPEALVYLNTFRNKQNLLNFIQILPYVGGGTKTGAALNFTLQSVFTKESGSRTNTGVQQVAVVITDGESQDRVHEAAASLRRSGVIVYSVGVDKANETELIQIASHPPNEHVFIVKSFAELTPLKVNSWRRSQETQKGCSLSMTLMP